MKRIFLLFLTLNLITTTATDAQSGYFETAWAEADSLTDLGLWRSADPVVVAILERARQADNQKQWARALIERVRLQTALGAPETAVRDLLAEPWPSDPVWQGALELFHAQSLVQYQLQYSHEIRQRELIATGDSLDLKAWTNERLSREINGALQRVWAQREQWGHESLGVWSPFISQNNYPARIRGTLRDAVSYLWVAQLANTRLWLPSQQQAARQLDLEPLLTGADSNATLAWDLSDPHLHPLRRISFILHDLRDWHLAHDEPEAALEAELTKVYRLNQAMVDQSRRVRLRQYLETVLADFDRSYPWWSCGQWRLSRLIVSAGEPDSQVRAHLVAAKGKLRHPHSVGGRLCDDVLAEIERPSFSLEAMSHDAAQKRSIRISHRNLERLHFRAWPLDLPALINRRSGPQLNRAEIDSIIQETESVLAWTVELPATEDFRDHKTYTGLPACRPGAYLVVGSRRQDFDPAASRMFAVRIIISDLVITTQQLGNQIEVLARSAATGEPRGRVKLAIYQDAYRYRTGENGIRHRVTDASGRARFDTSDPRQFRILASEGRDIAWLKRGWSGFYGRQQETTSSFVYTDRPIYRPGQTVYWKTIAYHGNAERTEFQTLGNHDLTVRLLDTNGQKAGLIELRTNDFGSAAGSFEIPAGALLGNWYVVDSLGSRQLVRVEQYKRPTFAVKLLDPAASLQLGQPTELVGQADYLFGSPVTAGTVRWRVTRRVQSRCSWWSVPFNGSKVIASGESELGDDGRFRVDFTAGVDPRVTDRDPAFYRYTVEADVTNEGGETRSVRRAFNLGVVAIQASLTTQVGFARSGTTTEFTVQRMDLNRIPRAGQGQWSLYKLEQPERVYLPADRPLAASDIANLLSPIPGDLQNPRWQYRIGGRQDLREWPAGDRITGGDLQHGPDGLATIRLSRLPAGPVRLVYTTRDTNGRATEARREFVVTGRERLPLNLPLVLQAERNQVSVADTARFLFHSGLTSQPLYVQVFVGGRRIRAEFIRAGQGDGILAIPVTPAARRGLKVSVTGMRDHQHLTADATVHVPWDNMQLDVSFATFRDRLYPGTSESFTVTIKSRDGSPITAQTTELLAYMYDRSLDALATQRSPRPLSVLATARPVSRLLSCLGSGGAVWVSAGRQRPSPPRHELWPDRLQTWPRRGLIVGRGSLHVRGGRQGEVAMGIDPAVADALAAEGTELLYGFDVEGAEYMVEFKSAVNARTIERYALSLPAGAVAQTTAAVTQTGQPAPVAVRRNFAETAFWLPHVQISADGTATVTYKVPDSVTNWNVQLHALTRDLHSGATGRTATSRKDLMVRPYLPRFLREGDTAQLKVVVDNTGTIPLQGRVELSILDPDSGEDLSAAFGLEGDAVEFAASAGGSTDLVFALQAPNRVGSVLVKTIVRAGNLSDGEQHLLPILPGRMHLSQSRFVALRGVDHREMTFPLMASDSDATRVQEQLVITIDGQLFGSVLSALPYLVDYSYECTEQTMNRYLSTGILAGIYREHPAVQVMATRMADRTTTTEAWRADDPNRRLLLEESPWLRTARGDQTSRRLFNMLEPATVRQQRESALAKLSELQTSDGGFPWFPGGRPRPHVTLTVLLGLARGAEFGVKAPDRMVAQAWRYLRHHYESRLQRPATGRDGSVTLVTLLNYLLSSYPSEVWQAAGFTSDDRDEMLARSLAHQHELSRLLSSCLALTLHRAGRTGEAQPILARIMDAAISDPDLGTYWAPEDRAWLWYNDTIESHAFALRMLNELAPADPRRQGLVQWLLLNKKLGHWKSTRATAEVIYALVHFMEQEGNLDAAEAITVSCGPHTQRFEFEPGNYSGGHNQIVYTGDQLEPQTMATVAVSKETPGLAFASATWHFSTEQLPDQAAGDLFTVSRRFFRREHDGTQWVLHPLAIGDSVAVGDQLEIQLAITARQAAEYVHLRAPRGAGFEPQSETSGYHWQNGLGWYEEVRDSGTNFFFDRLPTGQYTLKYRLRASMAGKFKVGPVTLQSMYAPEFAAYSTGRTLAVSP